MELLIKLFVCFIAGAVAGIGLISDVLASAVSAYTTISINHVHPPVKIKWRYP